MGLLLTAVAVPCAPAAPTCHDAAASQCCCPPGTNEGVGCRMACHQDPTPVSTTPSAPASTWLSDAAPSGQTVIAAILLPPAAVAAATFSLPAPPLERYLLACVLRL